MCIIFQRDKKDTWHQQAVGGHMANQLIWTFLVFSPSRFVGKASCP